MHPFPGGVLQDDVRDAQRRFFAHLRRQSASNALHMYAVVSAPGTPLDWRDTMTQARGVMASQQPQSTSTRALGGLWRSSGVVGLGTTPSARGDGASDSDSSVARSTSSGARWGWPTTLAVAGVGVAAVAFSVLVVREQRIQAGTGGWRAAVVSASAKVRDAVVGSSKGITRRGV